MDRVQIFGVKKSADTRKALRFFKERRIPVHFVDLTQRAASKGELRRFAQAFGVEALLDSECQHFKTRGLVHATYSDDRWLGMLADDPMLLNMPLVRFENRVSIGLAEEDWRSWLSRD